MRKRERSRVIHLSDAQIRIPRRKGEHAIRVLQRGTLDVALSIPKGPKGPVRQTPHDQDEVYFVVRGRGRVGRRRARQRCTVRASPTQSASNV